VKKNQIIKALVSLIAINLIANCATPINKSIKVQNSSWNNGIEVISDPVPATDIYDTLPTFHQLGFSWNSKTPEFIVLTVKRGGTCNIQGLQFKINNKIIETQTLNTLTHWKYQDLLTYSVRDFIISVKDFYTISRSQKVMMRIDNIDDFTITTFGRHKGRPELIEKFDQFILKVRQVKTRLKRRRQL
jgi:hypothetical protein